MIKVRHILFTILAVIFVPLLSGCQNIAMLNPTGIMALQEKKLLLDATGLMLLVVVPVILMTLVIAWRYRDTPNNKAKYRPNWSHNNYLEAIWWTIPCIIIVILSVMTWKTTHKLDPYRPLASKKKTLVIQAIALNWKWLFVYPDQHIASVNYINIPKNVPVRVLISSDGPMNALEMPQISGQIYAMAGMRTKLNVMGNKIGNYAGFSANYSGAGFSWMDFRVQVSSEKDFAAWVKKTQQSPKQLTVAAYNKFAEPSEKNKVEFFSHVAPNIFQLSLKKFMKPGFGNIN